MFFLAAIIAVLSVTAVNAQDTTITEHKHKTEYRRGGDRVSKMYDDLNLSSDQKDKLKVLKEEQRAKFEEIKNDASLNDDQRKEKMMELRKARKEKMDSILTDEQKAKLKAKMKERWQGRRGGKQN